MTFETSEIFKILYQGKDKVFFIKTFIKIIQIKESYVII